MYCLSTFLQQCGCSFTNFSLCEVYLLTPFPFGTIPLHCFSPGSSGCIPWSSLSDVSTFPALSAVHLHSPLTSHLPPPPLCSTRFLLCAPPYAPLHSRALMHSASAPPHPPSTFPSLQSHLYSPLPIPFYSPTSASCFSPCVLRCLGHSQLQKKPQPAMGSMVSLI